MKIKLSEDQKQVLRRVWKWVMKKESPYLTFGGYAGTGKTTMIAVFRKVLHKRHPEIKVAFCSYTGKATRVLEKTLHDYKALFKGDRRGTIHSLIYEPVTNEQGRVISWKQKDKLKADLIIVDEASMVDSRIWSDLHSYDTPILAVGDHGQLPPIRGDFNLMEDPQLKLEKIHRQAKDNPIIQIAEKVRQGKKVPVGEYGSVTKLSRTDWGTKQEVEDILSNFSQDWLVLVGYNHSRLQLNQEIRRFLGMQTEEPEPGDLIICLKNNYEKSIYNGMRGKIQTIRSLENEEGVEKWYEIKALMDNEQIYEGRVLKQQFNQSQTIQRLPDMDYKQMGDLFDFGYVLTVHKAQGSQAPNVLLFEERFKRMNDEEWRRWLYTAVTRAEEKLVIIGE